MVASLPTFVLVGGEAYELQGKALGEREFQHTSVPFIGSAYEALRAAGVERRNIITIVQLADYLQMLTRGETGEFTNVTGIPPKWYTEQREKTEIKCRRLIDEGGANYDASDVNPATVWSVLLGEAIQEGDLRPVVRGDDHGAVVFGMYSHGDCHPAVGGGGAAEWFAHFPYPSRRRDMYEFVATDGAKDAGVGKNRPECYLYSTQLRLIFHKIFERSPRRPIIGLLNYCSSGGNLEFMRREHVRRHLNVDRWPLYLMSSSQAGRESMVAGMWDAWFGQLQAALLGRVPLTVQSLFAHAEAAYYRENLYELSNAVKAKVYVPRIWSSQFSFPGQKDDSSDPWHIDLTRALMAGAPESGGAFSYTAVAELQFAYEAGEAYQIIRHATPEQRALLVRVGGVAVDRDTGDVVVWMNEHQSIQSLTLWEMHPEPYPVKLIQYSGTVETGRCVHLVEVVQRAFSEIAQPEEVHGPESGVADLAISELFQRR